MYINNIHNFNNFYNFNLETELFLKHDILSTFVDTLKINSIHTKFILYKLAI